MKNSRIYFQNLDLIRFVAAYMIVIFHLFYGWQANWGFPEILLDKNKELSFIGKFIENGFHNLSFGVDVFLLISGFLITYLLLHERATANRIDVPKFYMRRVLRIWPLYYLTIAIGPLLTYLFAEPEPSSYIPHLLFVGNFELINNGMSSAALNHLWSICIEEHFYLVCPLLVAFVPKKYLGPLFLSIIAASIIYRISVAGTENYWMKIYMNTLSRADVLAIGCYTGLLYYNKQLKFNTPVPVQIILYSLFVILYFSDVIVFWDNVFLVAIKKYFYVLIAGLAIGNLLFNNELRFMPTKKNFLHYLGKVSYGIYMFNPIVVALFIKLFYKYQYFNGWVYFFGIHLVLLVFVIASYHLYERPFLLLKERFSIVKSREKA